VSQPTETAAKVAPKPDLVTLTIDDVPVSVPKGTLIIRAAEMIGTAIPRFCDHPLLDPVGACRQCLVDIPDAGNGRGFPKPQASCTMPVAEGMVVRTQVNISRRRAWALMPSTCAMRDACGRKSQVPVCGSLNPGSSPLPS